tara:strand:- start:54 stop:812 length:759 start_codon:yes stop_codon:yes gene_type:complete
MATRYSPKITTRGLIFLIDPVNPRCVEVGDTDCLDLVGGKRCSGASGNPGTGAHTENTSNFPALEKETSTNNSSHVFYFTGSRGFNIDEDLGTSHAEVSLGMWLYKTSTGGTYMFDFRNDTGNWYLNNYNSTNFNAHNQMKYNFAAADVDGYDAADFPTNVWIHVMIVDAGAGTSKIYLNGRRRTTFLSNTISKHFGINARIGTRYTTSGGHVGVMGPIYLYNKALTDAEVKQNFLAHVGRYEANLCPESSF